jgi:hypothetical protein
MSEQQQSAPRTLKQKTQIAIALMQYPALTVMVFLRYKIGFRQLKPAALFVMALLMLVMAQFASDSSRSTGFFAPKVQSRAPKSDIPEGYDAPLPANWRAMDYKQRNQWMQQHRLTPEQLRAAQERVAAEAQEAAVSAERRETLRQALFRWPLTFFAIAMFILGTIQRRRRWKELTFGIRWHTRARGISYLAKLLPVRELIVQRFIDPAACFIAGYILLQFSQLLGLWLMFSGMALYFVEQYVYEQQLEQELDLMDGLIDAEVRSENVQHFEGSQQEEKGRSLEETAGIPTGIAPELEAQIAKRKKRAPPPDNLAVVSTT